MNDKVTREETAIERTEREIRDECNILAEFLIGKNRAYGDSALNPRKFFAKGEAEDLINVRLDDKLNRLLQGKPDGEDPLKDLVGYYVLREIAKKRRAAKAGDFDPKKLHPSRE